MQETRVPYLHREGPLEEEMASHSSVLAWEIPWTEEPGNLDTAERLSTHSAMGTQKTPNGQTTFEKKMELEESGSRTSDFTTCYSTQKMYGAGTKAKIHVNKI